MPKVAEVEELALSLSAKERGRLASKLIASLGSPFDDAADDGVEEALRRSREMDEHPEMSISMEQLDAMIKVRFPQCMSD